MKTRAFNQIIFPTILLVICIFVGTEFSYAQLDRPMGADDQTVGLFLNTPDAFEGYTLFAPLSYGTTYLIDNEGRQVHTWTSEYEPGNSVYLLENGHLLRTNRLGNPIFTGGGTGGLVQEIDWDGNVIWEFQYSSNQFCQHHDVEYLPNGNVLMIGWEYKTKAEAVLAGRNPNTMKDDALWPDHVIEVNPSAPVGSQIVWEWHVWDHLVQEYDHTKPNYGIVADHPELIHFNYTSNRASDWNHINGIDYNAELDQIVLSVREFSEFWVIDHSTTTEEAAGHTGGKYGKGGDLLYRWGNPKIYRSGPESAQALFVQHDAQWIPEGYPGEGNILVFNNGADRPTGNWSSVDEIDPPIDENGNYTKNAGVPFGPDAATWTYATQDPATFYSSFISGAERQPNGNTLICSGANGRIFEVKTDGTIVWEYINPVIGSGPLTQGTPVPVQGDRQTNTVFRAYRYAPDYAGLAGKDLTPGDPIEIYPTLVDNTFARPTEVSLDQNFPNPFNPTTAIGFSLPKAMDVTLTVANMLGQQVDILVQDKMDAGHHQVTFDAKGLPSGIYFARLIAGNSVMMRRMVLMR